jgi:hypothetical protein
MKNFKFNHIIAFFVIFLVAMSAISAQTTYDFQRSSIALSGGYEKSNYASFSGGNFNLEYNYGFTEKWNLNLGGGFLNKTYEEVYLIGVNQSLKSKEGFINLTRSLLGSSASRHNLKLGIGIRLSNLALDYSESANKKNDSFENVIRKSATYNAITANLLGQYDIRIGKRFFIGFQVDANPLLNASKLSPLTISLKSDIANGATTIINQDDGTALLLHGLLRFGMFF